MVNTSRPRVFIWIFLPRKMDYSGNSISNQISIHLKEFQDFHWEHVAAVFPLRLREVLSPGCVCTCGHASQGQKGRACLFNLKGQSSNKSHPVKLEKTSLISVEGIKETQQYTQYVGPVSSVRAGKVLWPVQGTVQGAWSSYGSAIMSKL